MATLALGTLESRVSTNFNLGDYVAVHQNPIWREKSNFIVRAHIGLKDGQNEWEQLWVKKIAGLRFTVCCIPFFVYDLALGDEIETDINHNFLRVVRPSGQATFRVWFGGQDANVRRDMITEIEAMRLSTEWFSENLVALSVQLGVEAQTIANFLCAREQKGLLQYETGCT
jgi:hypothetical protein